MGVITQRSFSLKRAVVTWDTTEVYGCSLIPIVRVTAQLQTELSAENPKENYALPVNARSGNSCRAELNNS
jgi:hypothetical protein